MMNKGKLFAPKRCGAPTLIYYQGAPICEACALELADRIEGGRTLMALFREAQGTSTEDQAAELRAIVDRERRRAALH